MKYSIRYRAVTFIGRIMCPRSTVEFEAGEPEEPGVIVCNHAAMRGPIMITLYYGRPHKNWVITYALDREKTANFAFHDFFVGKGRRIKWPWRFLSWIVKLILPNVLEQADPIAVYHDGRVIGTFRESMKALGDGYDIVVFGESPERYSEYVNKMQQGIVDLAALYYRRTGKRLAFYPAYVEKKNRKIKIAPPILFDPDAPQTEQREAVCDRISSEIDRMAREMKPHRPVPFLPERWYKAYGEYEHDFDKYWQMIENGK